MEEGSVAVAVESDGLPAGSEVCLVNEETGEELCEPVPDSGTEPRPGILAFRQATLTVTFENVPVGTWRLVLRVPGFEDLVINETVTVTVDQVTDAGEIPADVEERLEPVTPPGQMPTDVLIRLLIALLISILTSFGSR